MIKSLVRDALILIGIFSIIWAIFYYYPLAFPEKKDFEISVETEEKLGDAIVDNIIKKQGIDFVKDSVVNKKIKKISDLLIKNIGPTNYKYKVLIIESPEINAFTLPGGNIFIFSGLIEFSESPEEVGAVVAHELGHAEKRHVVSRLIKETGISILFSAISGGDANALSDITRRAASTVFDREQEKEADEFSFILMEKSGINPKTLGNFFKRLKEKHSSYRDELEILMTHPNHDSRIRASEEYKVSNNFKEVPLESNWSEVKKLLRDGKFPKSIN